MRGKKSSSGTIDFKLCGSKMKGDVAWANIEIEKDMHAHMKSVFKFQTSPLYLYFKILKLKLKIK